MWIYFLVPPAPSAPLIIKTEGDGGVGVKLRPAPGINGAIIKYFLVAVNASLFENKTPDDVTNEEVQNLFESSNILRMSSVHIHLNM